MMVLLSALPLRVNIDVISSTQSISEDMWQNTQNAHKICTIDSFKKGEFGTNEIGIIKYDLNDDGKKDDASIDPLRKLKNCWFFGF